MPSDSKQTTTEKWKPYGPAKEGINQGITDLGAWYAGPNPSYYPGSTYAGLQPVQQDIFGKIVQTSKSPNLGAAASGYGAIGSGGGAGSGALNDALSAYGGYTAGDYAGSDLLGRAGGGYGGMAAHGGVSGAGGLETLKATSRGDMLGRNPYADAAFSHVADQIGAQEDSRFASMGRGLSPAHAAVIAQQVGAAADPFYSGIYQSERQQQLDAARTLQGGAQAGLAGLAGLGGQQAGYGLAGAAGLAGVGGQQQGGQLSGLAGLSGIDAARLANLGQAAGVGQVMQGDKQAQIDADIQRFNFGQNRDLNKTLQYLDSLGFGQNTGIRTGVQSGGGADPWQTAAGILFGGLGTAGSLGWSPFG